MALEDLTSSPIPTFAITAKLRNSAWLHFAQLLWTGICCSRRQKPPPPIISTARSSSTFSKNASRTPDYTHPRHSSSPDFAFDKAVNSPFITLDTEQVDACSGSSMRVALPTRTKYAAFCCRCVLAVTGPFYFAEVCGVSLVDLALYFARAGVRLGDIEFHFAVVHSCLLQYLKRGRGVEKFAIPGVVEDRRHYDALSSGAALRTQLGCSYRS